MVSMKVVTSDMRYSSRGLIDRPAYRPAFT